MLSYFELSEDDLSLLASLEPTLEKHADSLVAAFYRHMLSFRETRELLRDEAVKERLLVKQRAYLLSLAAPVIDADYVAGRERIGQVHERLGLRSSWYLGAYSFYLSLLTPILSEAHPGDPLRSERALRALQKRLLFDAQIAMECYSERRERDLAYLNEELSNAGRLLARDFEARGVELRRTIERVRAAEQLASIGTLVAGLAHEIGTPLGVIQGHAKLLESAVEGEKPSWRLRTIQEQIARISRIIESLLNMARPGKRRQARLELEPLIESTLAFLEQRFRRRGVELVRDFTPTSSVQGNAEALQQLCLNLFLNAADAMPDGGTLRVSLHDSDGEVELRIADTGTGIAPEDLEHVFDPFYTTKEAGEGHGLGLAVAAGIVSEHGGEIEVSSEAGEGTEFRILLPFPESS